MIQQEKEKMFLDLNSVLVKFWIEQGRPDKEIKIELLERMLNWYKKMGYVIPDGQSKEPVSEELEDAADREARKVYPYEGGTKGMICETSIPIFKSGFIAGAEWQRQRTPMPEDTVIFQKGIEEGKRLMMEDAVKADIMLTLHDKTGDISLHTGYLPKELGIKCDDKVKIIIVKED